MSIQTLPFAALRAGDRILDGPTVEGTRRDRDGALRLVNPYGQSEWWLYPDLADEWPVQRPDDAEAPAPPARGITRPIRRTVAGLLLTATAPGEWTVDGGRYQLRRDREWFLCDDQHPVREYRGKGYLCPGEQEHAREEWGAWDLEADDWVGGLDPQPTLHAVAQRLADRLAAETRPLMVNLDALPHAVAELARHAPRIPATSPAPDGRGWRPAYPAGRAHADDVVVGQVVAVPIGSHYRFAVVTKAGPKRLRVEYTTPNGLKGGPFAGRLGSWVPRDGAVYFVGAGENWARLLR